MRHFLLALALTSCASAKPIARAVIDLADAACIVAHAHVDEDAILKACMIERKLLPVVRELVAAQRESAAKAGACRGK